MATLYDESSVRVTLKQFITVAGSHRGSGLFVLQISWDCYVGEIRQD